MASVTLPGGGYIADTPEGRFVVYDYYNTGGPRSGSVIAFSLDGVEFAAQNFPTVRMSAAEWAGLNVTKAGSATELGTFSHQRWGGGTAFQDFVREQAEKLFPDIDIKQHPDLLSVMFQYIGRPDMTDAEIENLVRNTDYWKGRTDLQREWSSLSPGEREFRINEQAAALSRLWQTYLGTAADPWNSEVRDLATKLASGEVGQGYVIEIVLKPRALQNPESPYSRQLRDETEAQRTRPVDIENQATQVRQLSLRWGISMTQKQINDWATGITTMERSNDDLLDYLRRAATQLYPWKDPELETEQAAQPWLAAYERTLGRSVTLMNTDVQRALQASQGVPDFEMALRQKPEWVGTQDHQERAESVASDIGRRFGFV